MPRKKRTQQKEVQDYRHDTATRKNNPPAGIAAQGRSKTTDTTPPPEKTIHPPASPHKGKSTKHRSRNTHTTHTCHPTLDPTQTETLTNSPSSCK